MFGPLSEWFIQNQRVDLVFYSVLLFSIVGFLMGEGVWFTRKLRAKQEEKVYKRHFEAAWSLVPLLVLLSLTFVNYRVLTQPSKLETYKIFNNEVPATRSTPFKRTNLRLQ